MDKVFLFTILASFVAINATKTPVLIWSPDRPLSDLPQSYAGSTVSSDLFHQNYLQPLTSTNGNSLVIFQQDKLSVEDFTNHADVYNPNSDGGAFKNVKSAMDGQFSVHLPAVGESTAAINTLSSSFPGELIRVDNPSDIDGVNLEDNKSYLIIVNLKPVDASNEYNSFKQNDEAIGEILHSLGKRGIKYSAVYTGESPTKVVNEEVHSGRKLLDVDPEDHNGTFVAKDGILFFLKYVSISIKPNDAGPKEDPFEESFAFINESQLEISDKTNKSMNLKLTLPGENGTVTIAFMVASTNQYEFASAEETFSYKGQGGGSKYDVTDMPLKLKIQATRGFCYHCSMLRAQPWLRNYTSNNTVALQLYGFQMEAYNPFSNSTEKFTRNVWDCVEFFTIPIWMGIITTLLLVIILFYAITMISNLTTMDRFDDPKGKTITVTVNE